MQKQIKIEEHNGAKFITFYDSEDKSYTDVCAILERLRKYSAGTVIDVYNQKFSRLKADRLVCTETYYLVYDCVGRVFLMYCNLQKCTCDVIGTFYYNNKNNIGLSMNVFQTAFEKVRGRIMILHDGAVDTESRQGYCIVNSNNWQIVDEKSLYAATLDVYKRVLVKEDGKVKMPLDALNYKVAVEQVNNRGKFVKRYWLTCSDAVMWAMQLAAANKGLYLVCNKNSVLFAVRR